MLNLWHFKRSRMHVKRKESSTVQFSRGFCSRQISPVSFSTQFTNISELLLLESFYVVSGPDLKKNRIR